MTGRAAAAGVQWNRVLRFRSRYVDALGGAPIELLSWVEIPPERQQEIGRWSNDCEDWAVSCCQNLHHLKDWLAADPTVMVQKPVIERYVNDHEELQIVADICNGTKHAELKGARTAIEDVSGIGRQMTLSGNGRGVGATVKADHFVMVGGVKRPLLELIDKSIATWKEFFELHQIGTQP